MPLSAKEEKKKIEPPAPEVVFKDVFNPRPLMDQLVKKTDNAKNGKMNFLVFGDSKGSRFFNDVIKGADALEPDFCLTTADLVNNGAGPQGLH